MTLQTLSTGAQPTHEDAGAQLACLAVINTFAYLIDNGMAARAVDLFTDAAEMKSAQGVIKGAVALRKTMATREADVQRRTRHQVTNVIFHEVSSQAAKAQSVLWLYVLGGSDQMTPRAITVFDDEFTRGPDDRWRFAKRTATLLAGSR
jgi:3-phenylpropionate/cinnamic acid dioxygenase small subunit